MPAFLETVSKIAKIRILLCKLLKKSLLEEFAGFLSSEVFNKDLSRGMGVLS